jgi:hypothetical protein
MFKSTSRESERGVAEPEKFEPSGEKEIKLEKAGGRFHARSMRGSVRVRCGLESRGDVPRLTFPMIFFSTITFP